MSEGITRRGLLGALLAGLLAPLGHRAPAQAPPPAPPAPAGPAYVTCTDDNAGPTTVYRYDADGRCISVTESGPRGTLS